MLYKTDTTQSELAAGAAFSTSGLSGGAMNGYGNGADARTVFVSKTTIPRVERSSSSGMTERTFEKSSESRIGNGTSYTISYQHSTVRNVSSTLPRKQPTYVSSSSYSQVSICSLIRNFTISSAILRFYPQFTISSAILRFYPQFTISSAILRFNPHFCDFIRTFTISSAILRSHPQFYDFIRIFTISSAILRFHPQFYDFIR